eukprot:Ihof_evm4s515 gene=Ihof_evmTU4s515
MQEVHEHFMSHVWFGHVSTQHGYSKKNICIGTLGDPVKAPNDTAVCYGVTRCFLHIGGAGKVEVLPQNE